MSQSKVTITLLNGMGKSLDAPASQHYRLSVWGTQEVAHWTVGSTIGKAYKQSFGPAVLDDGTSYSVNLDLIDEVVEELRSSIEAPAAADADVARANEALDALRSRADDLGVDPGSLMTPTSVRKASITWKRPGATGQLTATILSQDAGGLDIEATS
ncbi:MAG: hypothetical protein AAF533_11550 [Acidobacteriota bacterium]